ncbi:high frequency lysogenization protein HflD [Vibrio vulnificus]|uniref:High frequency lysogenization protein HflD homolog n=3 Tax=Vibrio vulnificus TaxID=672 RepID=HFLD_VIBVU|nr:MULTISPECIES: high frequency lysogenization protein HflD [Vibrio]Q7MLT5.2 RecName: Full=High frequency lysogenization protein HflD homolog [Vibrio vulnificus YJ016]Q8D8P4.1 RecName: Full=High frequency lysogenization protein HflD homolog [Vibrio vulnificus CMCP6]MCF8778260.1 high frequency lysogenization protein HflD [Vibrio floridensis]NVC62501.1 high frequency lysogenization protein HflD [Vibrio sp. 05-20-BW147]OJI60868.1 High frequency lysogenization protein HflD [Vibrio fluvialis]AAO11
MANTLYDRTIAFAGMCQAVALVQQIARNGHCDQDAFETSIKAILNTNPANTLDVFGNESQLKLGLECLVKGIDSTPTGSEVTRYLISLMALERKLMGRNDAMSQLGDRIQMVQRQTEHYDLFEEQMISNVASIYLDVISPIGPRIQVTGTPTVLQQTSNQHKVRALLLSGIRSAVLWRQVGGRRRHLIFGRKKMVEQAQILLARM